MNAQLKEQVWQIKSLEKYSHINLDDVLNKVTQEVWELVEASMMWDNEEMYKEAWDVLANIFSVCYELGINLETEWKDDKKSHTELIILLWQWNFLIQDLRNRFSRKESNPEELTQTTSNLVKAILNYSDPNINLWEILKRNIEKFEWRKEAYKQQIDLKDYIANYPDFPKPWINFKDISPLIKDKNALHFAVMELVNKCQWAEVIAWLDARWFIFGSLVAKELWIPFIMLRKKWKLPWNTKSVSYWLEYWKDILEIQEWSIEKWQKVAIIDDLLATWWTIKAAIDLVESTWGEVQNLAFAISLDEEWLINLDSRKKLEWYKIDSLVSYS